MTLLLSPASKAFSSSTPRRTSRSVGAQARASARSPARRRSARSAGWSRGSSCGRSSAGSAPRGGASAERRVEVGVAVLLGVEREGGAVDEAGELVRTATGSSSAELAAPRRPGRGRPSPAPSWCSRRGSSSSSLRSRRRRCRGPGRRRRSSPPALVEVRLHPRASEEAPSGRLAEAQESSARASTRSGAGSRTERGRDHVRSSSDQRQLRARRLAPGAPGARSARRSRRP